MEQYRIVVRFRSQTKEQNRSFIVQIMRSPWFGRGVWKDVDKRVGLNTDEIYFSSYEEAEEFITNDLIRGDGEIEICNNVYKFRRATYYV
jgi:hypothetical protein